MTAGQVNLTDNIVACDPGWSGAFAIRPTEVSQFVRIYGNSHVIPTPGDASMICATLKGLRVMCKDTKNILIIEQVGGFAGKSQPGSAMFRFGENFGLIIGAAIALGYRVERVTPQKWIKAHGLGTRGDLTKAEWKRKLKSRAQELYPNINVTLEVADALLILDAKVRGLI